MTCTARRTEILQAAVPKGPRRLQSSGHLPSRRQMCQMHRDVVTDHGIDVAAGALRREDMIIVRRIAGVDRVPESAVERNLVAAVAIDADSGSLAGGVFARDLRCKGATA